MAELLAVHNPGEAGLDLVSSPVHSKDGTFLTLQNAQLSQRDDELALRKRDGMTKLNASVAAGRINAIYCVNTV